MDIVEFQKFLKERVILINYASGCFGGFLTSVLYLSDNVWSTVPNDTPVFNYAGAAHTSVNVIENFHDRKSFDPWFALSYDKKLIYLWKNFLFKDIDPNMYYVQRLCSPKHHNEFSEFFNPNKTIIIKPNEKYRELIEKLVYHKILKDFEFEMWGNVKIPKKNGGEVMRRVIAKRTVKHFLDGTVYDQDFVIDFENFLDKDSFLTMMDRIKEKFNIEIDSEKLNVIYDAFYQANSRYINDH